MMLGVCCDVDIFKLTASAQSIYRVYAATYFLWINQSQLSFQQRNNKLQSTTCKIIERFHK